jgi:hypothetical protein
MNRRLFWVWRDTLGWFGCSGEGYQRTGFGIPVVVRIEGEVVYFGFRSYEDWQLAEGR